MRPQSPHAPATPAVPAAVGLSRDTELALAVTALGGRPLTAADSDVIELVDRRARPGEIRSAILAHATTRSRRRPHTAIFRRHRPYLIRGTHTLENQFDITDPEVLAHVEALFAFASGARILRGLGGAHPELSAIHTILFCDVYPWAGQARTVDLVANGHVFLPARHVAGRLSALERPADRITVDARNSGDALRDSVADGLAEWLADTARAHPFRTGNLRAAVLTACCTADTLGITSDPRALDPAAFRAAAHAGATRHRFASATPTALSALLRELLVAPD